MNNIENSGFAIKSLLLFMSIIFIALIIFMFFGNDLLGRKETDVLKNIEKQLIFN